ncbi:MAG TPA: hypothetical protein ENH28_01630 [Euryarchaeota archaeon]|nr:hypothetical protein [Euryarchaeota archaeon]
MSTSIARIAVRCTVKDEYRTFVDFSYSNAPEKSLLEVAIASAHKLLYLECLYGRNLKGLKGDFGRTNQNSPLSDWQSICLLADDGSEYVCLNAPLFLNIVEEISGLKLLRKDYFPVKRAIKILDKHQNQFEKWKVRFLKGTVLIKQLDSEIHYLIAPYLIRH